jgi:hypothetical protein
MVYLMHHYGQECEISCGNRLLQYHHVVHFRSIVDYNTTCDVTDCTVIINSITHYNGAQPNIKICINMFPTKHRFH